MQQYRRWSSAAVCGLVSRSRFAATTAAAAHVGSSSSASCVWSPSSSHGGTVPVLTSKRTFTNFFSRGSAEAARTTPQQQAEDPSAALKIDVADLANGDDMPPMLQYNDSLVEAALSLLEFVNNREDATQEEVDAVGGIVGMLFGDSVMSPYRQYLTVAKLTDLPSARKHSGVLRASHQIIAVILPDSLAAVIFAVDGATFDNVEQAHRDLVHRLVQAIIDHRDAGDDADEALLKALQKIESEFPELFKDAHYIRFLRDLNRVCLQARFAYLINETCLAFDPERTGRIKLAELKESLEKLMPPHAVKRMLDGCEPDDDGSVYYPQVAALLMRGEGPVRPQGTEPTL